ncbi:DUF6879 family protein [Streptomyces inhibens]|uniref:DUF6879 family protein n=1 Tax=Streptomyces inhibens TaxID=2293571 RepID=UPI0037A1A3B8
MPDAGKPHLDVSQGERLSIDAYRQDFRERRWAAGGRDSWKLERQQNFQEPRNKSWQAFSRGDWSEALRLIGQGRDAHLELSRKAEAHRSHFFRVRVVEKPLTPYLEWELTSLRLRAEVLGKIRVWEPGGISGPMGLEQLEESGPLPEIVTLGGHTLYKVLYDDHGISEGAVRFTDSELVARWERFIQALYREAEDLLSFFEREVAPLTSLRSR